MSHPIELRREDVPLADLVNGALEICEPAIRKGGHLLSVDIPHEAVAVHCDRARMIRVLGDLLSDAASDAPRRGRVEVVAGRGPGGIEISIRAKGQGTEFIIRLPQRAAGRVRALRPLRANPRLNSTP